MIDAEVFIAQYDRICRRFRTDNESEDGEALLGYLDSQAMNTDEFLSAAQAIWATHTFFPRPADFLLIRSAASWSVARKALEGHSPPHQTGWLLLAVDERARRAVIELGGLDGLRDSKRSMIQMRKSFEDAYEQQVTLEALGAVTPPSQFRALSPHLTLENPDA